MQTDCSDDVETALLASPAEEEYDNEDEEDYKVSYWAWPSSELLNLCTRLENNQQTHLGISPLLCTMNVSNMQILANALRRNHSLQSFYCDTSISLDHCSNDAAVILWKSIARCNRTLESLQLSPSASPISAVNEFVDCFAKLKILSEIDFPAGLLGQLDFEAREKFHRALVRSVSLQSVHLSIADSSIHKYSWFGRSLSGCQSLRKLSVTGIHTWYNTILPEILPEASVTELMIRSVTIGEVAAKEIGKLIPQLESFSMEGCLILPSERETLLDFMLNSKSLNLHTLHWPHVGDVGATMFSRLLQQRNSSSLKVLRIGGVTTKGAIFLADAILKNTTLDVLDLPDSRITKSGLDAFGRAIQVNSTLRELLIFNGSTLQSTMDAEGFVTGLEKNQTLVKVAGNDGSVADLVKKGHDSVDLAEYIDFVLLCNRNQNWDLKNAQIQLRHGKTNSCPTPSHDQTTKVGPTPVVDAMTTTSACNQCSVSNIPEKQILQCSQRLHNVCKKCVEACLETRLGESHMSCPIAGCTCNPWRVESDFYGFVSQFHYKMHCKEVQQQHSLREMKDHIGQLHQQLQSMASSIRDCDVE